MSGSEWSLLEQRDENPSLISRLAGFIFISKLETERHYQIRTRVPDLIDVKAMVLLVTENLMGRLGSEAMGGDEKMVIGRYEMEYN